jgi:C1A family cysteine protease
MPAAIAMKKLSNLERGERLTSIDIGLPKTVISQLTKKGIRSTIALFEVATVNEPSFAKEYGLTTEQLDQMISKLEEACGSCSLSPEYKDELRALSFPILPDEEGDIDGNNSSASSPFSLDDLVEKESFTAGQDTEVAVLSISLPIRDQMGRGTCVAFAATRAFEIYKLRSGETPDVDYSEHFLHWNTKEEVCPGKTYAGTKVAHALTSLQKAGVCTESDCPYEPTVAQTDKAHKGSKPSPDAYSTALKNKLSHSIQLTTTDLSALKTAITNGAAVVLTIPVFLGWLTDVNVRDSGILYGQVGSYDKREGGHAITLVGYFEDEEFPEDSYFVFDNSWGKRWAPNNEYGAGRGILPFSYITDHCVDKEAFVLPKP